MPGVTIWIFLADGTARGLPIIDKSNWTGLGFDVARAAWTRVRVRSEYEKAGTYALVGPAADSSSMIYVGEADERRQRAHPAGAARNRSPGRQGPARV